MFDWVWMHLWRIFVLEIPRKLTSGNSFCKVTGSKILILMKQDSTRERKFEREHHCKIQLLKLLKRPNPHGCFHKPATYWKWTPPLTISWKLRRAITGAEGAGGLLYPFLRIKKVSLFWKKGSVSILFHLKCSFRSIKDKRLSNISLRAFFS